VFSSRAFDLADAPGDRGGGSENMVALIVAVRLPAEAAGFAAHARYFGPIRQWSLRARR
jgi:hypothetical protein